ncbi:MAG: TonB-dependent receptor [Chitinophagaceae bacterium]|nr:TonB-dependent receptor [Chitinophagaceae bacterium]
MDSKTGEPLPGATIYCTDDKNMAVADEQGNYKLTGISAGHHVIEISYTGYGTLVEHIEIAASLKKDFSLSHIIIENQEVIVTGVSGPLNMKKNPVPLSVIKKNVMLQSPSANLIDALSKVPGVSQISSGQSVSKPIIRGLGYNRVVTVNDGVRQEGQQWGDEHGIEIDELSVSKVEILKGPASLMYGSDALAGVVNFITNVPVAQGLIKGNLLTSYQTNGGMFATNAGIAGNENGFNWSAYGTFKSAGDYKNKYDGRVLNSRFNEKNFGGYVGINKSWGYSHLILSRFNQKLGMVEGDREDATGKFILFAGTPLERIATDEDLSERKIFTPKQRVQHTKLVSDNNFVIRKSRLKLNMGYQSNIRKEFGNAEDPSEEELFFDLRTINYNLQWHLPETKEWHTTIGVNGMTQANKNKGQETLIPEYNLFDAGLFVYTHRYFKKATLSGGIRFDNRAVKGKEFQEGGNIKFSAFRKSFSNFSGSIGISYEAADALILKANIARGFRAPSLAELSSNGTHEGTSRYEYGTLDLKSETSLQFDGGMDINYDHLNIAISAFYNRINDFIFYRKLESAFGGDSLVNVDGEAITAFQFNQNSAKLYGLEIFLDFHPHPLDWLHFENSFSFVRGSFDKKIDGNITDSDNLPMIPAPRWIGELRGDFKKAGKELSNCI